MGIELKVSVPMQTYYAKHKKTPIDVRLFTKARTGDQNPIGDCVVIKKHRQLETTPTLQMFSPEDVKGSQIGTILPSEDTQIIAVVREYSHHPQHPHSYHSVSKCYKTNPMSAKMISNKITQSRDQFQKKQPGSIGLLGMQTIVELSVVREYQTPATRGGHQYKLNCDVSTRQATVRERIYSLAYESWFRPSFLR